MITLYTLGRVHPLTTGETRDLRAEWALEEVGLPYRIQPVDYTAGQLVGPSFGRLSSFHQVPVIDDEGFIVAESGAVLLYVAEKAGKLIPNDYQGRIRVIQWCFAALTTIEPLLTQIQKIDKTGNQDPERRANLVKTTCRRFDGLERRLVDREWIACAEFTIADVLLSTVLRQIRSTDLLDSYPRLKAFYERGQARPAWQRTLDAYAQRLGVNVADIR